MRLRLSGGGRAVCALVVLSLLVVPVAVSAGGGGSGSSPAAEAAEKKGSPLMRQVRKLKRKVNAQARKIKALEGKPGFTELDNGDLLLSRPGKEFIFSSKSFHIFHPRVGGTAAGFSSSETGFEAIGIFTNSDPATHEPQQGFIVPPAGPNQIVGSVQIAGNTQVNGSLSVTGTKAFRIDHPLDPRGKWLYHWSIESPDVLNVYGGNVRTDKRGLAVVRLPPYFAAINRDVRYQLTVVGSLARAVVWREVSGNRFMIRTTRPRVKVSWQVAGVRYDAYSRANASPAQVPKTAVERSSYGDG